MFCFKFQNGVISTILPIGDSVSTLFYGLIKKRGRSNDSVQSVLYIGPLQITS